MKYDVSINHQIRFMLGIAKGVDISKTQSLKQHHGIINLF